MTPPRLRPATAEDVPALARLYEAAVRGTGPQAYTPEQVEAWAGFAREDDAFRRFVLDAHTLVAEEGTRVVGFAGLTDEGLLASLYVHPDHGRSGVASLLLESLLDRARALALPEVRTHASDFSEGAFRRAGFTVEVVETVERRGRPFRRHVMVRRIP